MHAQLGVFVVIQAGTAQIPVIQFKAKRAYQVKLRTGVGAQADDVAGVWRYLGMVENDIEHPAILTSLVSNIKTS